MNLVIDGLKINSEDDLHDLFVKELNLPGWYGRNLDALWDVLTGMISRPLKITWMNSDESRRKLARYENIVGVLREVEERDKSLGKADAFSLLLC